MTKYFYFDTGLETIAARQYENYQNVVDDYRAYTGFRDYTEYQNDIIDWANIYVDNDTLMENSRFLKVTEEMEAGGISGSAPAWQRKGQTTRWYCQSGMMAWVFRQESWKRCGSD